MAEEGKLLRFLYHTAPGRLLLRPLAGRGLSRLVGRYLDSPLSRVWIRPFVKKNGIDPGEPVRDPYTGFPCVRFPGPDDTEITVIGSRE